MPSRSTINTHRKIVIGFARFEYARIVIGRHVPVAAHLVIDMLAVLPSVGASASAEAKFGVTHEAGPFCVLEVGAEGIAIDKTANGVTVAVSTMRIQFTTRITLLDIDLGEITDASNLDIVLGANEVNAFESAVGNDTRAPAALSAPGNFVLLCVADIANLRRCPQTKVVGVVDPHGLAH